MKEPKYPEVARRFREALSAANLSQQELADRSGIGKSSISQYVNGTHVPGNKAAGELASHLQCSPLWLMGFEVEMDGGIPKTTLNTDLQKLLEGLSEQELAEAINYLQYIKSKRK